MRRYQDETLRRTILKMELTLTLDFTKHKNLLQVFCKEIFILHLLDSKGSLVLAQRTQ